MPFIFLLVSLLLVSPCFPQVTVFPLPKSLQSTPGCLTVPPSFSLETTSTDPLLLAALDRTSRIIHSVCTRGESVSVCSSNPTPPTLASVAIRVVAAQRNSTPALGDDESYTLSLVQGSSSQLTAPTVWGALRGLESLSQLFSCSSSPDGLTPHLQVAAQSVTISDSPRFSHRGLMVDTGRAFLPLPTLLATLDAMAYVKLNVLHWHLTDDQAFPIHSTTFPKLTLGAMQAPSNTHTYSGQDVAMVVAAATARGIRVIPEFDVPGHVSSWFAGYPELSAQCENAGEGEFSTPMDPTLNATYQFIGGLFEEMGGVFPDQFFHIGGDEVQFTCWLNSTSILAFMAAHNMTLPSQLQLYFEARVAGLLGGMGARSKTAVIWEENFGAANVYPTNAVVEVWKEPSTNLSVMEGLVKQGFTVIYTTPDWYLDWTNVKAGGGASSSSTWDTHVNGPGEWEFYHSVDPLPANTTLTPGEQARVLGGEVCMWTLYEDATNFLPTVFPRALAVAERLWSAQGKAVDEPNALGERMQALRCRLVARGVAAAPINIGLSCPSTGEQRYTPPY